MNKLFRTLFFLALPLLVAVLLVVNPLAIVPLLLAAVMLFKPMPALCDATLILPMMLGRVMDAYKARLPMLNFFSWDINPTAAKWDQEIIAQMPQVPVASDHVPGTDLTVGAQNVKDLITDVPMRINRAKKVVLKVPTADAVKLMLDTTFTEALSNAGYALAKAVVAEGLAQITPDNFSYEIVEAANAIDKETLSSARVQMNTQLAGVPRFGLTTPTSMSKLTNDTRISSGDYYGQRVEDDPYVTLRGIEGFQAITEFTDFPTSDNLEAFFFDRRAILFAVRKLQDTLDMARRLGIPTPILDITRTDEQTGLTITAYLWIDVKTHDIYVAFVVGFGFRAGKQAAEADPNSLMDRSGLRVVTAATA